MQARYLAARFLVRHPTLMARVLMLVAVREPVMELDPEPAMHRDPGLGMHPDTALDLVPATLQPLAVAVCLAAEACLASVCLVVGELQVPAYLLPARCWSVELLQLPSQFQLLSTMTMQANAANPSG